MRTPIPNAKAAGWILTVLLAILILITLGSIFRGLFVAGPPRP